MKAVRSSSDIYLSKCSRVPRQDSDFDLTWARLPGTSSRRQDDDDDETCHGHVIKMNVPDTVRCSIFIALDEEKDESV